MARTNAAMPAAVPATWGTVRLNPNRIPEARSRALFGPGVIETTNAKPTSPSSLFMPAVDNGRRAAVLYDLGMAPEWVRAGKPVVPGVHEVFHARFVDYAYPPHVHDTWTVCIVDDGWIRYDLETRHRGAGGQRVTILPPHVVDGGRAADGGGFRKRVLYIVTEVLDERLIGRAVDRPASTRRTASRSGCPPTARATRRCSPSRI